MTGTLSSWLTLRLGRVTSSGKFVPVVDGLRCVAIGLVVLYHLAGYVTARSPYVPTDPLHSDLLARLIHTGNCGVQLFFAISGLILALPFAEQFLKNGKPVDRRTFYLRRLTRLAPPYLINLLIVYGLLVATGKGTAAGLFPHVLASVGYMHNLVFGEASLINGVAWSLEVEVQFYLLAPFLALGLRVPSARLRRMLLAAVIGLLILLKATVISHLEGPLTGTVLWHLDLFLVGFLLADWLTCEGRNAARSVAWDALSAVGWAGVVFCQMMEWAQPFIALPVALAYWGVFRGVAFSWLLSRPVFVIVGGMCYTIYLWHFFILSAVGRRTILISGGETFAGNLLVQAGLILPVVLAVSTVLFLLVEKPFMKPWGLPVARPVPSQA